MRRGAVVLLAALALTLSALASAAGPRSRVVTITFTGKGGGRYLDHTRWLREDTRECYASLVADEDLRVQWRLQWRATLGGLTLRSPATSPSTAAGSVDGSAVRDSCDSADEEPGWGGTTVCKAALALRGSGGLAAH